MIPKVIHYCWFGGNELPDEAKKCIESWREKCPDYEIIEWNETNYDVTKIQYMREAYEEKKWAFVSDCARIDIIYQHGGIYMDTDVELIKPLDAFLDCGFYAGWERRDVSLNGYDGEFKNFVAFGLGFGAEKGHKVLKDLLDYYDSLKFRNVDGTLNLTACPFYQTQILVKHGLDVSERSLQSFDDIIIYPDDYFSPKSFYTGMISITENTVSIHHFAMSWKNNEDIYFKKLEWNMIEKYGVYKGKKLVKIISIP